MSILEPSKIIGERVTTGHYVNGICMQRQGGTRGDDFGNSDNQFWRFMPAKAQ